jgi:hypothetical protein
MVAVLSFMLLTTTVPVAAGEPEVVAVAPVWQPATVAANPTAKKARAIATKLIDISDGSLTAIVRVA